MSCNGNCGSCGGCGRSLELTEPELTLLKTLGQIPFLPVERDLGDDTPHSPEAQSLVLQCMEKKGLISLDYDLPIRGHSYGPHALKGSFALTARGQQVLELIEYRGLTGA